MGDHQVETPAASSTTVDMEAAEQLIQLSGGCDDASVGGGGESESRSADSVKAGEKESGDDKEGVLAVVESSTGEEQRGDAKKEVPAAVESSSAGKRSEKPGAEKGRVEDDEAVMGGVVRRRPRFRSPAAIYKVTKRIDLVPCREEDQSSTGKGKKEKKKQQQKRRARDSAADDEAIPAAEKKAVRRRTTVRES